MSTSPSNSSTSATSSADARERAVAAALIANEATLLTEAQKITCDLDLAREVVTAAFLDFCRQTPEQITGGTKEWLEAACLKRARKLASKSGKPGSAEELRWKRVAGTGEAAAEAPSSIPILLPSQRESILHAARQGGLPAQRPAAHPRWLVPMAGATVLAVAAGVFLNRPHREEPVAISVPKPASLPAPAPQASAPPAPVPADESAALPLEALLLPLPGPAIDSTVGAQPVMSTAAANARTRNQALESSPGDFLATATKRIAAITDLDLSSLPDVTPRDAVQTSTSRQLPLPILSGNSSLGWISSSVTSKRALPPNKAVRLDELLNAFSLKPGGTAAVSKGASLVVESLSCPWKPSATLAMIRFQGAADGPHVVEAVLNVDPIAVSQFRLLGYAPVKGLENATLPTVLSAKTGTTLLIQIEPRANAKDLGEIRWQVDGKDVPSLPIQRVPDAEPSIDARFGCLLAAWSMWLTREQPDIIDEDLVGGLARECAAGDLPKDRKDAIVLIAKSLELR